MTDSTPLPEVELFIKASYDKEKQGGCPMCHQWFMACYCMAERRLFNLTVTTIATDSPPSYFSALNTSGRIPAVLIKSNLILDNSNLEGMVYSTYDEIEGFMKMFRMPEFQTARESKGIAEGESAFLDLKNNLNILLKSGNPARLSKTLHKIDAWLGKEWAEQGTHYKFLLSDELTYADVQLVPKLQHVRVAGKFFNNFELDGSLKNLWRYLNSVYQTKVFKDTCPSDQSIIKFYQDKVTDGVAKTIKVTRQAATYTATVPDGVLEDSADDPPEVATEVNGGGEEAAPSPPPPPMDETPEVVNEPTPEVASEVSEPEPTPEVASEVSEPEPTPEVADEPKEAEQTPEVASEPKEADQTPEVASEPKESEETTPAMEETPASTTEETTTNKEQQDTVANGCDDSAAEPPKSEENTGSEAP